MLNIDKRTHERKTVQTISYSASDIRAPDEQRSDSSHNRRTANEQRKNTKTKKQNRREKWMKKKSEKTTQNINDKHFVFEKW